MPTLSRTRRSRSWFDKLTISGLGLFSSSALKSIVHFSAAALIGIIGFALSAAAENISVSSTLDPTSVYLGETCKYQIVVTGAAAPPAAAAPRVDGLSISFSGTSQSSSSNISIINGKMTQESHVTYYMTYQITPARGGTFQIPPFTVTAGSQTFEAPGKTLAVTAPAADDRAIMEVAVSPNPVVVGESFTVVFKLFLRKLSFQNTEIDVDPVLPREPPALQIPWFENLANTETKDFQSFASGYIGNPGFSVNNYSRDDFFSRRLITFKPPRSAETRGGQSYFVYTIEKTFKAVKPGQVDLPPVVLKGNLPDQMVGPNEVSRRAVYQASNAVTVRISDPLTAGRPAEWTGAIGKFTVRSSADPVKLNLGDPITLTVTVAGTGLWNTVECPGLATQDDFARGFKVHDQNVPGDQTGDGKVFRFTIRPSDPHVKEVPPVRYAYYDPQKKSYATVKSQAIPIEIRSTEKVSLDEIVEAPGRKAAPEVREAIAGLYANEADPARVLTPQVPRSAASTWGGIFTAPALFLILGGISAIRARTDPARRRARLAYASFEKEEKSLAADPAMPDSRFISGLLEAAASFTRARLNLSERSLTAPDVIRHLTDRKFPVESVRRLAIALGDMERALYAGAATEADRKKWTADVRISICEIDRFAERNMK